MHWNGLSYLIIVLEDSSQPVQGIQPKNNNNGKAQMFVILLASMWNWVRGTQNIFGRWSFTFWSQNVKKILYSHGNWRIKYLLKMQHAYHWATGEAQTATCLLNCNMLTTQPTGEAQTATCLPKRYLGKRVAVWASPFGKLQHAYHSAKWRVSNRNMLTLKG